MPRRVRAPASHPDRNAQFELPRDNLDENRIASLEMLPPADPLPHLICSPPIIIGGGGHGADQHGDTR